MVILYVFVLFSVAFVKCQVVEQDSNCPDRTVNYYIYGPDGYTSQPNINPTQGNYRQGKPGKIGPRGDVGLKGDKGMKGEQGRSDDTAEDTRQVKQQLATLQVKLDLVTNPPLTCADMNSTITTSGTYFLSPSQTLYQPAISVYCNFSGNDVETIIGHDTMAEIKVTSCDPAKCYQRRIIYNAPMSEMVALIERSAECRQYIKYRCIDSVIFHGSNNDHATWLSHDGVHMKFWGGATSQRNDYCACGETGTCVDRTKKCNCDRNTHDETSDEGFLTDKDTLPVTELQFGDAGGTGEHRWHTLGPLICTGRNDQ